VIRPKLAQRNNDVMAGLVPAIHVFARNAAFEAWAQ
jgi:hypothetical protein